VARRLFDWRDPIDGQEIEKRLEMRLERRLLRNGHWIEIYSRRGLPVEPVIPVLPGPRR
jgi:hypothetical protein